MIKLNYLINLAAEEAPSPVIPHPVEIIVGLIAFSLLFYVLKTKVVPKFEKAYVFAFSKHVCRNFSVSVFKRSNFTIYSLSS